MLVRVFKAAGVLVTLGVLALLAVTGAGCASCGQKTLGAVDGSINDPQNRTLRRSILAQGLEKFCQEMTTRSAPLSLSPDAPAVGRFFPDNCVKRELPNGDLDVEFAGRGYAFTNLSKKLVFRSGAAVQYNQDFLMDGSTVYAYFRTAQVRASDFRVLLIEQQAAALFNSVMPLGDTFGRQLLTGKIQEGFTVIRDSEGGTEFSMGLVPKGSHPNQVNRQSGRVLLEAGRVEVHQNQRDFVGPLRVEGSGRALFLEVQVDGAATADVLVMDAGRLGGEVSRVDPQSPGQRSLDLYLAYGASGPLAGAPRFAEALPGGATTTRMIPVPEGLYYVIWDNTPSAGPSSPPMNALDDRAATVRYALQVGDTP